MKNYQLRNNIHSTLLCLISIFVSVCGTARAGTLAWTNTAGGSWNVAENWDPNQVPVAGDNVVITNSGDYIVTLDSDFHSLDNLVFGASGGAQILELSGQVTCSGTITVATGSALNLSQAWLQAAQVDVAGTVTWSGGSIAGAINVTPNGVLNITGFNDKFLDEGAAITNYGLIT